MKIVLSVVLGLFLIGCSNDTTVKEEKTKVAKTEKVEVKIEKKSLSTVIEESIPQAPSTEALYAKCSACHGANGEKVALGKSAIITAWEAQKVIDALNGYKDGSYGGSMKALMKGQVSNLSVEQIKALGEYISKLK